LRRAWPHLLILLAGVLCLAVTWHLEPAIRYLRPLGAAAQPHPKPKYNHYLRVVATQALQLRQLTLRVQWDPQQVTEPQVLRGFLTRQTAPKVRIKSNAVVIIWTAPNDDRAVVAGQGPVARLMFRQVSPGKPVTANAVRIETAIGITTNGRKIAVRGLRLAPLESQHPPARPAPARRDEEHHG